MQPGVMLRKVALAALVCVEAMLRKNMERLFHIARHG